jgi:hypothetical protein
MRRYSSFVLFLLLILLVTSCDEEIFGPRTWEGFWDVTENSEAFGDLSFTVWIEEMPGDDSKLIIYDFSSLEGADVAVDISDRTLTIQLQSINARGGIFRISGTGKASSNRRRIEWQYRIDGNDCTAIYIKR